MEPLFTELVKSVIAAGPMAIVLGVALKTVWQAYQTQVAQNLEMQNKVLDVLRNALDDEHDGKKD